jgi:hypothetical protein
VWLTIAAVGVFAVLLLLVASTVVFSSDILRQRLIATLSERLESQVELDGLQLRVLPQFHMTGVGLRIRHKGRDDVPPLIKVDRLTVDAGLPNLLRKHITTVTLTGLVINIPPDRGIRTNEEFGPSSPNPRVTNDDARQFAIDRLTSTDARLVIIPGKKDKPPKVWQIHQLAMRSLSFDRPMPFNATLTNAVPPGEIHTSGSFGPWQSETPGATPLEGTFTFSDADLSVFKGIAGILSAHGEFGGTLGRLAVHGETDTPQFTVAVGGHPVPLHADYHATVDGTNGDTLLDRIDGSFLNTSLVAKGRVVDTPGRDGRTVALDLEMEKARIEDVLRLVVRAPKSPMTGAMKLKTRFVLPPGDRDVVEKLQLDGQFAIATATFTNIDIQTRVDELSRRGRGQVANTSRQQSAVSNFLGQFKLGGGTLTLQTLRFETPGARVELTGTYQLRPELLDFKGMLLLDAKISETQTGWKRMVLKAIDPLFEKKGGGGSAIPIKIEGKRSDPAFGLDKGRLLKRGG